METRRGITCVICLVKKIRCIFFGWVSLRYPVELARAHRKPRLWTVHPTVAVGARSVRVAPRVLALFDGVLTRPHYPPTRDPRSSFQWLCYV